MEQLRIDRRLKLDGPPLDRLAGARGVEIWRVAQLMNGRALQDARRDIPAVLRVANLAARGRRGYL